MFVGLLLAVGLVVTGCWLWGEALPGPGERPVSDAWFWQMRLGAAACLLLAQAVLIGWVATAWRGRRAWHDWAALGALAGSVLVGLSVGVMVLR